MGRPIKSIKTGGATVGYNNAAGYGIVGGNTGTGGNQIVARVKIGANAEANGFIVRQKGARKFLVSDGTNTGVCVLANTADGSLANDTMTITATLADASTVRLSKIGAHSGADFAGNGYNLSFGAAAAAVNASQVDGRRYPVATVATA